jgi:hypothetical protein
MGEISNDQASGGDAPCLSSTASEAPTDINASAAGPVTPPAAPPAATIVANAEITEETLRLRQENESLRKRVKDREAELAGTIDEFHRYREVVEKPTTEPAPRPRRFFRHE